LWRRRERVDAVGNHVAGCLLAHRVSKSWGLWTRISSSRPAMAPPEHGDRRFAAEAEKRLHGLESKNPKKIPAR